MKNKKDYIQLSASDLSNFLNCKHLIELDKKVLHGEIEKPEWKDPNIVVLQERGFLHEKNYIQHLKENGYTIQSIDEDLSSTEANTQTIEAMKSGVDIITQGVLKLEQWYGKADILKKASGRSAFGEYTYEVMDTKLSKETKASAILQLCLYSEIVSHITNSNPEKMYIVTPEDGFTVHEYRVNDFRAYYSLVRTKLINSIKKIEDTYPEPVTHCDVCRWWEVCTRKRRADDHLSLVAGITKKQREDLETINIKKMIELAQAQDNLYSNLKNTNASSFEKIKKQAKIQVRAREDNQNYYELLDVEETRGLSRLPEPTDQDIFFDIEGDVFVGNNGLEYLLGISFMDDGKLEYAGKWALSATEEKAAFEWFMDTVFQKMEENPNMHIYHYAPYEPSACKRLAQRYSTREDELDMLLRAGKFIDLYQVVRQGVRASVEKYSIKDLEIFTKYTRKIGLHEMALHKRTLEHALELNRSEDITEDMRNAVQQYNNDDTDSTKALRDWLEGLRLEAISNDELILRPEAQSTEAGIETTERDIKIKQIKEDLTKGISLEIDEQSQEDKAKLVLSELMSFNRREEKVAFWEIFRLKDMNPAELHEDKSGISGLKFIEEIREGNKLPTHIYSYPFQEVDFRTGDEIIECGGIKIGSLISFDPANRKVAIKKTRKTEDIHPKEVYRKSIVSGKVLEDANLRIGEYVATEGIENANKFQALRDILLQNTPKLKEGDCVIDKNKNILDEMKRIVLHMNNTYLPIQGPPGAGKSYTASHLIAILIENGAKVGITAVSHKVISELMLKTNSILEKKGISCNFMQKVKEVDNEKPYAQTTTNDAIERIVTEAKPCLVGGTAWLFARETLTESLDYIFIDEAGQLSLSNVVSVGASAKNIVLLGDPQQLEQPIQASHPDGADKSGLEYIIGEHDCITTIISSCQRQLKVPTHNILKHLPLAIKASLI